MKLLLSGATGAAGSQILRSALADPDVTKITILSRRPLPSWLPVPSADKPTDVIVLPDFQQYPADVQKKLADHDACIWALGCSSLGMSEADYTRVTYDYVVSAVSALREGGIAQSQTASPFRFVFISGEGADPDKTNIQMFGRVKGRTEKYLTTLPAESNIKASVYRGTREAPFLRGLDCVVAPVVRTLTPSIYSPIQDLGKFSVELAKGRWKEETTFPNVRMRELMKQL
ncbi:hypothetical protein BDZ89DRAFT_1077507 [Hymenopellis radicata]|nr:hypothetical protein BDZ89DRAFT_1077507 [Hymenopellis radicata]